MRCFSGIGAAGVVKFVQFWTFVKETVMNDMTET